ncbi:efflux RND transporter periplasmic adaptor subunit [Thermocrinis jamiesonii]|jgi:RND family efflux transporter, MFP subunit|uniref:efflux RND transporter periplasmic adaptor subunit n=1 Tax=Thermocrinis jamiesonii TaxID=1302351 RepID=UPI00049656BE|nr:efflux RND transporter periplasmic adaptor subunit [Thermocrinis jamiesonii]
MLALLFFILLVFSCAKNETKNNSQKPTEKTVITTYTLSSQEVQLYYQTKGYFEAFKDVFLKPEVSGRVVELYVEEGSFVKQGQPLLRIDSSEYENTLRQLEAQLAQAKANYENQKALVERRKMLFERDLIAKEEYENALVQLRVQKELINSINAQIANIKLQLSKATLRAPFSGYIAQRLVSLGDYVTTQTQTFRLVTLDPIKVVFQIPQEFVSFAKLGTLVDVEVDGVGVFKGSIIFVSPVADQSRLITLKARLENSKNLLKPGMFAVVSLPTEKVSAFAVPERALVLRGTKKIVWKVEEGGSVVPVEVQVLRQERAIAYVKGDLQDGDRIALENASILREGAKVEIKQ